MSQMTAISVSRRRGQKEVVRKIGLWLKDARRARGLSQTELAAFVQVSYQCVAKWERGSIRLTAVDLLLILNALGVPFADFAEAIAGDDYSPPSSSRLILRLSRKIGKLTAVQQRGLAIFLGSNEEE